MVFHAPPAGPTVTSHSQTVTCLGATVIELSDVIRDLRSQLEKAVAAGDGAALRFDLGDIELELSVAVEKRQEGRAGVRFWVMELGGTADLQHTDTQRIKITLRPRMAATGLSPSVSGPTCPNER